MTLTHSHALTHLGILVRGRGTHWASLHLRLVQVVLKSARLVDVEGQVFLQLLVFSFLNLALVKVCLGLRL